jgi:hypothetical protein
MNLRFTSQLRRAVPVGVIAAISFTGVAMAANLGILGPSKVISAAEAPVDLGTAANFSVLAGSTVTNTGSSTLAQDLGVDPGSAATGFPPGTVGGETHLGDAVSLQAQKDLTTAYNDAAGRTPFTSLAAELGGTTLIPGVYRIGAAQVTGQLKLNAENDPQSVFIFQVDSTLTTASNSSVVFINGASPCNVYWQIGSSATLGTGTDFIGNIMAQASITMNTGANLEGRALARTAAVTLDTNSITEPICTGPSPSPSTSGSPSGSPSASPSVGPSVSPSISPSVSPSISPSISPSVSPSSSPSVGPSISPSMSPSSSPTGGYGSPTATPTGGGYGYGY